MPLPPVHFKIKQSIREILHPIQIPRSDSSIATISHQHFHASHKHFAITIHYTKSAGNHFIPHIIPIRIQQICLQKLDPETKPSSQSYGPSSAPSSPILPSRPSTNSQRSTSLTVSSISLVWINHLQLRTPLSSP